MVADPNAADPADVIIVGETAGKIIEAMRYLDSDELAVVRWRYGLHGRLAQGGPRWWRQSNLHAMTTKAVAEKLGLGVKRVKNLERRALAKLRVVDRR